jgi:glyoxylase-like metal-dependent hydrolase (beta-lactamase superfamily II)
MTKMQWTEPGAFEVSPDVFRIPLPLPDPSLHSVNVYALRTDAGIVMIDAGWALTEARDALSTALGAMNAEIGDISEFLITHMHQDHYPQAVILRQEFGMKVRIGEGERASIEAMQRLEETQMSGALARLDLSGAKELADSLRALLQLAAPHLDVNWWLSPDEWLRSGTTISLPGREIEVIATPGHTVGHVVYRDVAHGLLFAGDHILPHITPSIGLEPVTSASPLSDYLKSLRLLRQLPDQRLLPAHGAVVESAHVRIDELLDHHAERLERMRELVAVGHDTAFAVATAMTWTRHEQSLAELDPFNQFLAVNETLAHLDVLAEQGKLNRTVQDGVAFFAI